MRTWSVTLEGRNTSGSTWSLMSHVNILNQDQILLSTKNRTFQCYIHLCGPIDFFWKTIFQKCVIHTEYELWRKQTIETASFCCTYSICRMPKIEECNTVSSWPWGRRRLFSLVVPLHALWLFPITEIAYSGKSLFLVNAWSMGLSQLEGCLFQSEPEWFFFLSLSARNHVLFTW